MSSSVLYSVIRPKRFWHSIRDKGTKFPKVRGGVIWAMPIAERKHSFCTSCSLKLFFCPVSYFLFTSWWILGSNVLLIYMQLCSKLLFSLSKLNRGECLRETMAPWIWTSYPGSKPDKKPIRGVPLSLQSSLFSVTITFVKPTSLKVCCKIFNQDDHRSGRKFPQEK